MDSQLDRFHGACHYGPMNMPKIAAPRDTMVGCMWLPRLLDKCRLRLNGTLPAAYEARLFSPTGVDGQFLAHFGINGPQMLKAAALPNGQFAGWFIGLEGNSPTRIKEWNSLAVNLGRRGFPMEERLPIALARSYPHIDPASVSTVFEALEADEREE